MKVFMLAAFLTLSVCTALPTPLEQQQTEIASSVLAEERAEQTEVQSSTAEAGDKNGFLEELFDGVADAVTGGALSQLTSVALKPIFSAVGTSFVEQIFSAANELIKEWKMSKRHNFEAHPIFIPDRGSFILVSADWIIPEPSVENSVLIHTEEQTEINKTIELNTDKQVKLKNVTINAIQINTDDTFGNVTNKEDTNLEIFNNTNEIVILEDNNSTSTEDKIPKSITINSTVNAIKSESNTTESVLLNYLKPQNITEDTLTSEVIADFEINNEIERRNLPEDEENVTISYFKDINNETINENNTAVHETNSLNYRQGRTYANSRFEGNLNPYNIGDFSGIKSIESKTIIDGKDVSNTSEMHGVIQLKNVYLIPVQGDVDWSKSEDEIETIQEAVRAVMITREYTEGRQRRLEQFLGNKLRQMADALAS